MRTIARILGCLAAFSILMTGIFALSESIQKHNEYIELARMGGRDQTGQTFLEILLCVAECIYGLWVVLGAWLVAKHPLIAFLIFLLPGSLITILTLPSLHFDLYNIWSLAFNGGNILVLLSCITAFIGIWEKDHHSILLTTWNN